jgi:hypothetical protein
MVAESGGKFEKLDVVVGSGGTLNFPATFGAGLRPARRFETTNNYLYL